MENSSPHIAALEEHSFIENFEKIALRLNIANVPHNELCLRFQEFLTHLKKNFLQIWHYQTLRPTYPSLYQSLLHVMNRKNLNFRLQSLKNLQAYFRGNFGAHRRKKILVRSGEKQFAKESEREADLLFLPVNRC